MAAARPATAVFVAVNMIIRNLLSLFFVDAVCPSLLLPPPMQTRPAINESLVVVDVLLRAKLPHVRVVMFRMTFALERIHRPIVYIDIALRLF